MVSSGTILIPLRITVEISSGYDGSFIEPATAFHEASINLTDVIVRTLSPDCTRPDRKQIEIHAPLNANRNHPCAEESVHRLKRKLFITEDRQPFVQIGTTEPQAGETVGVQNIHRFLGTLLNDGDVRIEPQ